MAERVKDGVFAAMMDVALVNDGPVSTCHLEVNKAHKLIHCTVQQVTIELNADGAATGAESQPASIDIAT